MFGVDPQKLAAVQSSTKHITGVITVDYKESTLHIQFSSIDPEAVKAIPGLLESFSTALAQQLQSFFAITGEIVEVGKDAAVQQKAD